MKVIYIDELFLLNLVFDYLLLLATSKICSAATSRLRLGLAAALGASYAAFAALPGFAALSHPVAKITSGGLMLLAAFGFARRFGRIALVFFAVSAAGAGAVAAAGLLGGDSFARLDARVLAVTFIVCYAAVTLVFRRAARPGQRYAALKISLGGRETTLRALVDTGNALTDPVTRRPAAVLSVKDAAGLFPARCRADAERAFSQNAPDALAELARLFPEIRCLLIPYDAVGSSGSLAALVPDEVCVNGESRAMLIAVSPNGVCDNLSYAAVIADI